MLLSFQRRAGALLAIGGHAACSSSLGKKLECSNCHSRNLTIANGVSSVQPMGHPITSSSNSGEHIEPMTVPRKGLLLPPHSSIRPIVWFRPPFTPLGVGSEYPHALAPVREANGFRTQHSPFRIEPERGQVTEDDAESASSER